MGKSDWNGKKWLSAGKIAEKGTWMERVRDLFWLDIKYEEGLCQNGTKSLTSSSEHVFIKQEGLCQNGTKICH
jgi:hypothetical protein